MHRRLVSIPSRLLSGLILISILLGLRWWINNPRYSFIHSPSCTLETTDSVLTLTFDDGPHPEVTPRLLQILRQYAVPATFFVNGDKLAAYPEVARQTLADGHTLGNHSMFHESMIFKSYTRIMKDVLDTDSMIRHVGQNYTPFYRPPYGRSFINLPRVLRDQNKRMVNWSIAPLAQYHIPFDRPGIERQVAEAIHPGGIILLHDGMDHVDPEGLALAVEQIILDARASGYTFVELKFGNDQ